MEWMAVAVVAALLGMAFGWFVARTRARSDAESKIREAESIAQTERIRGESLEAQRLAVAVAMRRSARAIAPGGNRLRGDPRARRGDSEALRGRAGLARAGRAQAHRYLQIARIRHAAAKHRRLPETRRGEAQGGAGCCLEGFRGAREKNRRPRQTGARIARQARRRTSQDGERSARRRGPAHRAASQSRRADQQAFRRAQDALGARAMG